MAEIKEFIDKDRRVMGKYYDLINRMDSIQVLREDLDS